MQENEVRYLRNPDFIFRKIVEEMVLVPIHQDVADMDCIYTLNEVGAFIWDHLDQPASQALLQDLLMKEYDADLEVLTKDIEHFLLEMTSIGAVKKV